MQNCIRSKNKRGQGRDERKKRRRNRPFLRIEKKLKIFRKIKEKTLDFLREIDYYIQALFQSALF